MQTKSLPEADIEFALVFFRDSVRPSLTDLERLIAVDW
jgi:hypothetical protein